MTPFDQFWEAWPRKTAKIAARKVWGKIDGDRHAERILATLRQELIAWKDRPITLIPHPDKWLRNEDFADRAVQKAAPARAAQGRRAWRALCDAVWDANVRFHRQWAKDSLISAEWRGRELVVVLQTGCWERLAPLSGDFSRVMGELVTGSAVRLEGE